MHALDREGRVVVAKSMSRAGFEKWIEALATPCVVAMEACGMAHYWARRLAGLGHQPRIICAEFVAPFRKGGAGFKNDTRDAEAVAIAARQPDMRFVAVKSEAQQAALMVHRLRQGLIEERTALINRLRGLLAPLRHWRHPARSHRHPQNQTDKQAPQRAAVITAAHCEPRSECGADARLKDDGPGSPTQKGRLWRREWVLPELPRRNLQTMSGRGGDRPALLLGLVTSGSPL